VQHAHGQPGRQQQRACRGGHEVAGDLLAARFDQFAACLGAPDRQDDLKCKVGQPPMRLTGELASLLPGDLPIA
jgi:hypothetical protein